MPEKQNEPAIPFSAFNFSVEITKGKDVGALCKAAFSECDGMEMTMEVKTIRSGGENGRQIRLAGPAAFGQLTLKRGMTDNFDLWAWFEETLQNPSLRANAEVVVLSPAVAANGQEREVRARFVLSRCLPVKLKAPPLNAKDGGVAIEELQLAYESLTLKK